MAIEQIDSFLSEKAEKQFDLIKGAAPELVSIGKTIVDVNRQIAAIEKGRAASTKELKDNIAQLEKENAALIKQQQAYAKLAADLERQKQQELRTSQETVKLIREEAKALAEEARQKKAELSLSAQMEAAKKREQKALQELTSEYRKLEVEQKRLEGQAKELGAIYGANSKEFLEAAQAANVYGDKLKAIDAGLGNHRRNVGNYASGYNILASAINQVSRELPNFGQSIQIGILSLSNQVGQVQDGIRQIVDRNKELIAQGKPTVGVLKSIAASFFTFTTALNVGVALLVAYSDEIADWASGLFKAKKTVDTLTQSTNDFNTAVTEGAAKEQAAALISYKAAIDVKNGYDARLAAAERLKNEYPLIFKNLSTEAIMAGQAADAYRELSQAIIAKAATNVLQEEIEKLIKYQESIRNNAAAINAAAQKNKILNPNAANNFVDQGLLGGKSASDVALENTQNAIDGLIDRILKYQQQYSNIFGSPGQKTQKQFTETVKETEDAFAAFAETVRNGLGSDFDFADEIKNISATKVALQAETEFNNQLEGIYDKRNRGVFSTEKEFQEALTKLIRENAIQRLDLTIATLEAEISAVDRTSIAYQKLIAELAKLKAERAKAAGEGGEGPVESIKEWQKELAKVIQYIQGALQIVNEITGLVNDAYDRKIEKLQKEAELIKENTENEVKSIERQALTEEEKERRIRIARELSDVQQRQLEQREKQARRKQAIFQKAANINDIIGRTAIAVMSAFATYGSTPIAYVTAALNGALGAAQLARVIATPIPSYAEGTLDHPGGKARVGEEGSELIVTPGGKMKRVNKETIIDLPAHSKVFNEEQLKKMGMWYPRMFKDSSDYDFQRLEDTFKTEIRGLGKIFSKKKMSQSVNVYGRNSWFDTHIKGRG